MNGVSDYSDILKLEEAGVLDDLPANTYEMIRRGAALDPGAPAMSFFLQTARHRRPRIWSYRQLVTEITRAANLFHALGARRHSVVAFILPNLPETHFVIWGAEANSIVFAVNPLLEADAIAGLLNSAGASILVTLAPFPGTDLWQKVERVVPRVPSLEHLLTINLADQLAGLARWPARWLRRRHEQRLCGPGGVAGVVPGGLRVQDFNRARRQQPGDRLLTPEPAGPDDLSSYFCTGGTTGAPKIAMRRHRNEVANVTSVSSLLGDDGVGPGKTVFCGLPLFHVNAVQVTGLQPFSSGAHVLMATPQGYRGDGVVPRFWELVEHHRVNFFSGVPTLYSSLLDVPVDGRDLSSLEFGLCGAAPLPVEVMKRFEAGTGLKILEGYGLTEGTCVSSVNPAFGERRPGSIGLRVPGQRMTVLRIDEQGDYRGHCAPGEIGVIAIAGPNVFAGYLDPAHDRGLWIEDERGTRWLNSGDLGLMDEDGYVHLTGRRKELIIRGGHNIDPAAIENVLHRHPEVRMAAAVPRPDVHAGELPVAYVQLVEGARCDEAALMAFSQERIGERAAWPKAIHVIAEMPLTPVGKIFKPALKLREVESALAEALAGAGWGAVRIAASQGARGIRVSARVPDSAARVPVREILGRFPFDIDVAEAGS